MQKISPPSDLIFDHDSAILSTIFFQFVAVMSETMNAIFLRSDSMRQFFYVAVESKKVTAIITRSKNELY